MPLILYIDTSSNISTILLLSDDNILAIRNNEIKNMHAVFINSHIDEILKETNTTWNQINAICVLNGPGSYTGLRISLASAKGFCYVYNIPLILISKLQLMDYENKSKEILNSYIIKAREDEYFFQTYNQSHFETNEVTIISIEDIVRIFEVEKLNLYSSDTDLKTTFEQISILNISNNTICIVVNLMFLQKKYADLTDSEPFYYKNVYINK